MLQTNFYALSVEARSEIMEGALAYHALKTEHHDYHHWVKVGKAIVQLRIAATTEAGVAFFMKQMTEHAPIPDDLMVRGFPFE